jgi:hypothetical protein
MEDGFSLMVNIMKDLLQITSLLDRVNGYLKMEMKLLVFSNKLNKKVKMMKKKPKRKKS